jgi:hypothetical protein
MSEDIKIALEEGVWHKVHSAGAKHRYLNLPNDQLKRVHFQHKGKIQFFIILQHLPVEQEQ